MFKLLFNLLWNRANKKQWQLQIGAHLIKKGCGYSIGQIVRSRKIGHNLYKVKVVTNLFYDFKTNQVNHLKENRVISKSEVEASR